MAARSGADQAGACSEYLTAYERERIDRINRNRAIMESMGILEQKTLFEAAFRVVKRPSIQKKRAKSGTDAKPKAAPSRSSSRLNGSQPEFRGLEDDFADKPDGRVELPRSVENASEWSEVVQQRRCDSQSRGSLYDSKAGVTCHFCRQKKLCGEADCQRCSTRDASLPCLVAEEWSAGKSECSRCASATGRFCRACLLIRYGWQLEEVRKKMTEDNWLCPHCYEEDHPEEAWICNSSICMTRRGLKPTGIAIFDAQQQGFPSVAHHVQAKLLQHRKNRCSARAEPNVASGVIASSPAPEPAAEADQNGSLALVENRAASSLAPKKKAATRAKPPKAPVRRFTRSRAQTREN